MNQPTLLLFPGLGVDHRIFGPQRDLPLQLKVAEWIEPESPRESLAHYAHRMVASFRSRPRTFIGGVSLGAMVALEAASLIDAQGVLVIGGCSSSRQISPLFRAVLAIGAALPRSAVRSTLLLAPAALKLLERLPREQVRLMTQMLNERSPSQLRWSCRALLDWECCELPPVVPVHHIHGENDEVIPLAKVKPQHVVVGGRHLINLTHVAEVNAFVLKNTSRIPFTPALSLKHC